MSNLYKNWWVHNLFAHPAMQFLQFVSEDLANKLHDNTLPAGYEV